MASNLEYGSVYGWGNIECNLFGSTLVSLESIEWKRTQKKELIYGKGREPIGVGRGNIEYDGTIEILWDELVKIIDKAPAGDILSISPFTVYVNFSATSTEGPRTVKLSKVEFKEAPFKSSQGDTSIKITLPILLGNVEYI